MEYIRRKYGDNGCRSKNGSVISQRQQAPFDTSVYIDEISDEEQEDEKDFGGHSPSSRPRLTFVDSPSFLSDSAQDKKDLAKISFTNK